MNFKESFTAHRKLIVIISASVAVLSAAFIVTGVLLNSREGPKSASDSESSSVSEEASEVFNDASGVEISDNGNSDIPEESDEDSSDEGSESGIFHGWVKNVYGYTYVYGDTGYLQFNYRATASDRYIRSLNVFASSVPTGTRLFNMVVPVSSTFADIPREVYSGDEFYNLSQSRFVANVTAGLDERYVNIDVISAIEELYDCGEYVFFRTDGNWTSEGAYAAYRQFCSATGMNSYSSESFPKIKYEGFLGSFYTATGSLDMADNPDTIVCYAPIPAFSADVTVYDSGQVYSGLNPGRTNVSGYGVFLGKSGADRYEITSTAEGGRLLIIGDSSSYPIALMLACNYSEVDIVDPQKYGSTFEEYIRYHEYDDILTMSYSVNCVNGDYMPAFIKFIGADSNE
ncbi:MAG: hypothetical protein J5793_04890 [Clostridia bacterium]|nr:hypothetical protein [Clostridia bacterium]